VLIAHRLSTITMASRVVLLDDGVIAASGTHAELLAGVPRYREILASGIVVDDGGGTDPDPPGTVDDGPTS
jgi:ATP-binding cassette subfamily B protein